MRPPSRFTRMDSNRTPGSKKEQTTAEGCLFFFWSKCGDSNSRPPVPETGALPTALHLVMKYYINPRVTNIFTPTSARREWRSLLKHSRSARKASLTPITPCFCAFATPKTVINCFCLLTTALHLVMKYYINPRVTNIFTPTSARREWRSLLKHSRSARKASLTPITPCFCAFATPKTVINCFCLLTTALHLENVIYMHFVSNGG